MRYFGALPKVVTDRHKYFRIIYGVTEKDLNYFRINYVTDTDLAFLGPQLSIGCRHVIPNYCRNPPESQKPIWDLCNQWTAKGASGKGPRQKTSKIVKKCHKYFRHFSTFFAQGTKTSKIVKMCQNVIRHFSAIFARHQFSGPF